MEALLIFTMAYLGNGILIALIALIVAGLWRLGRGRRFSVPAGVGGRSALPSFSSLARVVGWGSRRQRAARAPSFRTTGG